MLNAFLICGGHFRLDGVHDNLIGIHHLRGSRAEKLLNRESFFALPLVDTIMRTHFRLESVVQRQAKLGMTQVCIVPVYLFTGVLIERIEAQVERLRGQYPHIAFALAEYFGFDAGIFHILDTRVADALAGTATAGLLECDGCKYRELAEAEHLHDHSHTAGGCAHGHAHGNGHAHAHAHCHHA